MVTENQEIFLVIGRTDYEGQDEVFAFEVKAEAEDFAARCFEYEKSRPQFPDCTNGESMDQYWLRVDEWNRNHPAGDARGHSRYDVVTIPFVKASS